MPTVSSLVLQQDIAMLDEILLEKICNSENPLKIGKKWSHIRVGEDISEYYIIDTTARFHKNEGSQQRFNTIMEISQQKGFNYLVIIVK